MAALNAWLESGDTEGLSRVGGLLEEDLGLPATDPMDRSLLNHPAIVGHYAQSLVEVCQEPWYGLEQLNKLTQMLTQSDSLIRVRWFQPTGSHCYGTKFEAPDGFYTFWDDEPVMITRVTKQWLKEQTELTGVTRPEVRLLAALSFPVLGGLCYFRLSDKCYDLPADLVVGSDWHLSESAVDRTHSVTRILSCLDSLRPRSEVQGWGPCSTKRFSYNVAGISTPHARQFYDSFDIEDSLVLRTSLCLLKAMTLWTAEGRPFGEEACTNAVIALEGCLRLVHRSEFGRSDFEVKKTISHIQNVFQMRPGFVDLLQEAYGNRIRLVHPSPRTGGCWIPPMHADHFYDYYTMAMELLVYAVTGTVLPRED